MIEVQKHDFIIFYFRYLAVIYPLRYPSIITEKRSLIIITAIWILATCIGFAPFYCGIWNEDNTECFLNEILPTSYILIGLAGQYVLYSSIMIAMYSQIFYIARSQRRKISVTMGTWMDENRENTHSTIHNDTKTAKTLAMVLGAFLFSWTPFFILAGIQSTGTAENKDGFDTLYALGVVIAMANSSLNPIIYFWKSADFRSAFTRIVRKICTSQDTTRVQHLDMRSTSISPITSSI